MARKGKDLRAGAAASQPAGSPATASAAGSSPVAVETPPETTPVRLRDQPFTLTHWSATLPDRDVTAEEANGPLNETEQEELAECHRAIDNARSARWMLGRALEIVRRRRLYRGDGTRIWTQYLAAEHDGMSERDAGRLMEEWRLAMAVQDALGKPAPASHVRAMLDYADSTSNDQAAADYLALHTAFESGRARLGAQQITARVVAAIESAAIEADPQDRRRAVVEKWQQVQAPQPSIPAPSKALDGPTTLPQDAQAVDVVAEAVAVLEKAYDRLDDALLREKDDTTRSPIDAEHLQRRLRRIGRILAKVSIPGDDVVDAEVVEDDAAQQ
ncbi:hypothetical protein ACFPK5_00430 [Streptomyces beijiangensis]|uniref:hypothetical protein n=1 Tax=Streptomyces beijiangensis TaxID=163361 RepID=UPI0031CF6771